MENEKVFLRIETPFSLTNPNTRSFALMVVGTPIMMVGMLFFLYNSPNNLELAQRMTIFCALWFIMGEIPCALLLFNSYAVIREEELVVNAIGFFEKRYPREVLQKAVKSGSRIEIYSGGKAVASMPDSDAARTLVRNLRIPADWDNIRV